jgi:hypothetical protein
MLTANNATPKLENHLLKNVTQLMRKRDIEFDGKANRESWNFSDYAAGHPSFGCTADVS